VTVYPILFPCTQYYSSNISNSKGYCCYYYYYCTQILLLLLLLLLLSVLLLTLLLPLFHPLPRYLPPPPKSSHKHIHIPHIQQLYFLPELLHPTTITAVPFHIVTSLLEGVSLSGTTREKRFLIHFYFQSSIHPFYSSIFLIFYFFLETKIFGKERTKKTLPSTPFSTLLAPPSAPKKSEGEGNFRAMPGQPGGGGKPQKPNNACQQNHRRGKTPDPGPSRSDSSSSSDTNSSSGSSIATPNGNTHRDASTSSSSCVPPSPPPAAGAFASTTDTTIIGAAASISHSHKSQKQQLPSAPRDDLKYDISRLQRSDWVNLEGLATCATSRLGKEKCVGISELGSDLFFRVSAFVEESHFPLLAGPTAQPFSELHIYRDG